MPNCVTFKIKTVLYCQKMSLKKKQLTILRHRTRIYLYFQFVFGAFFGNNVQHKRRGVTHELCFNCTIYRIS